MRSKPLKAALLAFFLAPFVLPLNAGGQRDASIRFQETTSQAGLLKPLVGIMGHGGAWGDIDGDGYIDLFVGGFCDRPNEEYEPARGPVPTRLFRNRGDGTFELLDQLQIFSRTSGAVFADLDNNGTLELYAANNARASTRRKEEPQRSAQTKLPQLFRNDKGTFVDISKESGAVPDGLLSARNIGVLDYDNDGLLDLFVVEDTFIKKPNCVLLHNKGNLKFEDVTAKAGLPTDLHGLGLAIADLNEDGRPDIFVPHSNRLFLSQPKLKYREATELKDVLGWKQLDNEDWPCGAAFGDLNGDGLLDLVLSIHSTRARNKVFLNTGLKNGVPQFRDVTDEAGLGKTVPTRCPHVEIQDFDNDGLPDIYTSAGWLDDKGNVTLLIYRNLGPGKNGVPRFQAPRPIEGPMVYYPAGPSGDYDNDGRLDIFLINWFQGNHCRLLHNESAPRHWLDVQVRGSKNFNRMGIGAQVKVFEPGKIGQPKHLLGFQEVTTGFGYASGQPAICHFGLGNHQTVDVLIKLPSGKTIPRKAVKTNQKLLVEQ